MTNCDIVIPVWNQLSATTACIESVLRNTGHAFHLILIDNASEAETAGYLRTIESRFAGRVTIIRNGENLGFVKAVNQGMRISTAPYLCLLNNDTVVTDGWLGRMIACMESDPTVGILNPSSNTTGQCPSQGESVDEYAARLGAAVAAQQELSRCRGFCMLIRRNVVKNIGYLDETFGCGYFEETDYSKRALDAGFRIARLNNAYVYHAEGTSFKARPEKADLFERNERIFTERWGRQIRVGYVFTGAESSGRVSDIALGAARAGHQAFIIMRQGSARPVFVDHADIRYIEVPKLALFFGSLFSILRRKSKKRIEHIIVDSIIMSCFFKILHPLHGAAVYFRPDKGSFLARLDADKRLI